MRELSSSRGRRLSVGTSKIALTVGLCLCAGQLVGTPAEAAPAVAPAMVSASEAALSEAALSVQPRISMGVSTRTLGWGSSVRVTASIVDPRTGAAVRTGSVSLQAWRTGAWRNWGTQQVTTAGTVAFSARPLVSGAFRVSYSGAAGLLPVDSTIVRVAVRASGAKVITEAQRHNGASYRFGASGPRVFDCSGFTSYVFRTAAGKSLPHKADSQQDYGRPIARSNAQPGDLIVIRSGSYGTHAGVYAGGGYMYDSPRAGKTVGKHKIWSRNYVVKRLV